ncbi:MAG: hypothetical protein R3C53_15245 [Pirellulaceae bacterium]
MLLTGSYRRTLDDKLRLAIPKQLRDVLGFPETKSLFIAPGNDRALVIYTAEVLEQIGNTLSKLSPAAKQTRDFSRLFYAQAQPADVDRQGRLRVPPELAKLAGWEGEGFSGEIVILGVRDRIEIWSAVAWDAFLSQTQPSYDELAESVFAAAREDGK